MEDKLLLPNGRKGKNKQPFQGDNLTDMSHGDYSHPIIQVIQSCCPDHSFRFLFLQPGNPPPLTCSHFLLPPNLPQQISSLFPPRLNPYSNPNSSLLSRLSLTAERDPSLLPVGDFLGIHVSLLPGLLFCPMPTELVLITRPITSARSDNRCIVSAAKKYRNNVYMMPFDIMQ